jgi:isoaspartyl peptidase/L-asparaginase-like protein (Ntn-hydrolase superfamily)
MTRRTEPRYPVPHVNKPRRIGDSTYLVGDPTAARKVLKFRTEHSDLATIIRTAWAWHRKAHPLKMENESEAKQACCRPSDLDAVEYQVEAQLKFLLRNYEASNGIERAVRDLLAQRHRHDVLENCLRELEEDESIDAVGYGGAPNILGEMELDASFMDGNNRSVGAVAAVQKFLPIKIARRLMEAGLHTLLVGPGAERFAFDCDLKSERMLAPAQYEKWKQSVKPLLDCRDSRLLDLVAQLTTPAKKAFDTVIMVASDRQGLSSASSTSGWPWKHPGRLGDAPVPGAGFYADSRFGWCGCTHTGEMVMRAGIARYVVTQLELGKGVHEAVENAVKDLAALNKGLIGGVTIHAADRDGNTRVVAVNVHDAVHYWYWCETMAHPQRRRAEHIGISPIG